MTNFRTLHLRIFKLLPTVAIGITTGCFILGLLIVNLRLSWFGISSPEFARTEYILVGAVFIFLAATANVSFEHCKKDFHLAFQQVKEKNYLAALTAIFFGVITFAAPIVVVFGFIFSNVNLISSWTVWLSILLLILVGHITKLFIGELVKLTQQTQSSPAESQNERISISNRLLGQIAFLLIYLGLYSNFMYPHIPPAFAGGMKPLVILYPTQEGIEVSKSLSLPLHENPTIIGPVEILTESENEIVVLISNSLSGQQQAVRLDRKLFNAIQTTTQKGNREN